MKILFMLVVCCVKEMFKVNLLSFNENSHNENNQHNLQYQLNLKKFYKDLINVSIGYNEIYVLYNRS